MTRRHAYFAVMLSAAGIFALTMGIRQSQALFISPINSSTGLGIGEISFAFAVAQLMWGVTQPFAGAAADRYGAGRVLAGGLLLVGLGTALTPFATTTWGLVFCIGILGAAGAGAAGPGVLMAATTRLVSPEKRGIATGIVGAGGSFGQFAIVPLAQGVSSAFGWVNALLTLGAISLAGLFGAVALKGKAAAHAAGGPTMRASIAEAFRDRSYLLLCAGFFTCGFHVAFIATHLPGVVAQCGLPPAVGAWSLAVIGLFNIVGSLSVGWAVNRWRMRSLLSLIYAARAVAVMLFLMAPKTELTFMLFAAVIGVTYLSTVPPTAGLVGKLFGPRYMATLFGIVMLSHQVGGFLGAWLGGKAFDAFASYDWMWYADIALALFAAAIHLPIREAAVQRPAAAAA